MENNENIPQEAAPQEQVIQEPFTQPSAPKVSPFADSPYVMDEPQESEDTASVLEEPMYVPPTKTKTGRGKKVAKTLLASLLTIALVAAGCLITAACCLHAAGNC